MAIIHKFKNIDEYYQSITHTKTLVNDLDIHLHSDREKSMALIRTIHDRDFLDAVASCLCGEMVGNYLVETTLCPECKTEVISSRGNFDPELWCRGLEDLKFFSPKMWMLINDVVGGTSLDIMRWISDPAYTATTTKPILAKLEAMDGFHRSYSFLVENMEIIFDVLMFGLSKVKRESLLMLKDLYIENKHILYSNYLPIMGKKLFVQESIKNDKIYTDFNVNRSIETTLTFMDACGDSVTRNEREVVMARSISSLAEQVKLYYKVAFAGKHGGSRKFKHATRTAFSGRCVGTSITKPHNMETVEIPWKVGLVMLRPHLMNHLITRHSYSMRDAKILIRNHFNVTHPLLARIFEDIIAESKHDKGMPCIVQRNPTLLQSSILMLYIGKVKPDPNDNSIGLSTLLMTFLSGDFDGDEYNFMLLIDEFIAKGMETLSPASSVLSYDTPGEINGVITVTKASTVILANYFIKSREAGLENSIFDLED